MSDNTYKTGDLVKASYKSGEYIGEIVEMTRSKTAVKVLAVLKHPAQGDLHHPYEVDGVMFLQRKALSYQEIALMPQYSLFAYNGEVPDYRESLLAALEAEMTMSRKLSQWGQRSLEELEKLKQEY
ncbi:MAG: kinaseassociated protein [Paenibacillaceae bacterium]|jgi:kinase-associated protein B|nr:kinaseassociated protein [Paenibacillaceae bacterium]